MNSKHWRNMPDQVLTQMIINEVRELRKIVQDQNKILSDFLSAKETQKAADKVKLRQERLADSVRRIA
tara:strand:- start:525 stop:728 length:204 start_codon:yes stop_codon:yes gene_type:complete